MSAQIANKSASYAATILKRIAAASGAPLRTNEIKQRPSLLTATEDESVERELNHALSVIDELKTKRSAALSHIPPSFIANPTINFAGFKSMAERLKERTPHAAKWLALIQQNETTFNNDDIKLDPMVEDAIVNALVPVERSFADFVSTCWRCVRNKKCRRFVRSDCRTLFFPSILFVAFSSHWRVCARFLFFVGLR